MENKELIDIREKFLSMIVGYTIDVFTFPRMKERVRYPNDIKELFWEFLAQYPPHELAEMPTRYYDSIDEFEKFCNGIEYLENFYLSELERDYLPLTPSNRMVWEDEIAILRKAKSVFVSGNPLYNSTSKYRVDGLESDYIIDNQRYVKKQYEILLELISKIKKVLDGKQVINNVDSNVNPSMPFNVPKINLNITQAQLGILLRVLHDNGICGGEVKDLLIKTTEVFTVGKLVSPKNPTYSTLENKFYHKNDSHDQYISSCDKLQKKMEKWIEDINQLKEEANKSYSIYLNRPPKKKDTNSK